MEFSGIGPNTTTVDRWKEVAEQIAAIIQMSEIEVFRQAVQQVTCDRLKTEDERERREEARREALKESGVLYRDGAIPDRPEGDWYFHQDILGGYVKLPSKVKLPPKQPERPKPPACLRDPKLHKDWDDADKKVVDRFHAEEAKYNKRIQAFWPKWHRAILPLFEQVKKRGFPNDDKGEYRYDFDLCCWVPRELHPAKDPRNEELLPVPRRALTDVEKITVLAAVYDAHSRGSEKVAPWGLSEDGSDPDAWQADAERDEKRAALVYFWLFQKARRLDDSDQPVVESWLKDLPMAIKKVEADELEAAEENANEGQNGGIEGGMKSSQPLLSSDCRKKLVDALKESGINPDVYKTLTLEQVRNIIMAHWATSNGLTTAEVRNQWEQIGWPPSLGSQGKTKLADKVKTYIRRGQKKLDELGSQEN